MKGQPVIQSQTLPPVTALPSCDAAFLAAARDVATIAGGLMASSGSPLLAVPVPSDRWGDDPPLQLWGQRLTPCDARLQFLLSTPIFQPALDALHLAADALFERLETWGWQEAMAPGLCLITDGSGVALTTCRPTGVAGPSWLLDLVGDADETFAVLPFAADGIWALLQEEAPNRFN